MWRILRATGVQRWERVGCRGFKEGAATERRCPVKDEQCLDKQTGRLASIAGGEKKQASSSVSFCPPQASTPSSSKSNFNKHLWATARPPAKLLNSTVCGGWLSSEAVMWRWGVGSLSPWAGSMCSHVCGGLCLCKGLLPLPQPPLSPPLFLWQFE